MATFEDLSGRHFNAWEVLERAPNNSHGSAMFLCRCECGTTRVIRAGCLKSGKSKSCGCHKNDYNRTHGGKGTRLYEIWRQMRYRCQKPNHNAYPKYGGRGISVCPEWNDFAVFRAWALSHGYTDRLSIDRIDVDGNYCPENCRWADSTVQMNNRRTTPHYSYMGENMTLSEWSRRLGIPRTTLQNRIRRGKTFAQAVEQRPIERTGKNGESY